MKINHAVMFLSAAALALVTGCAASVGTERVLTAKMGADDRTGDCTKRAGMVYHGLSAKESEQAYSLCAVDELERRQADRARGIAPKRPSRDGLDPRSHEISDGAVATDDKERAYGQMGPGYGQPLGSMPFPQLGGNGYTAPPPSLLPGAGPTGLGTAAGTSPAAAPPATAYVPGTDAANCVIANADKIVEVINMYPQFDLEVRGGRLLTPVPCEAESNLFQASVIRSNKQSYTTVLMPAAAQSQNGAAPVTKARYAYLGVQGEVTLVVTPFDKDTHQQAYAHKVVRLRFPRAGGHQVFLAPGVPNASFY